MQSVKGFFSILSAKKGFAKCPIFDQNLELTPLTNSNFAIFQKSTFLQSRKACFPYKRLPKHFVDLFWPKRKKLKFYNFEPKPLENSFFLNIQKSLLLQFRKAFFSSQNIPKHIFSQNFSQKERILNFPIFNQNRRLTLSQNSNFSTIKKSILYNYSLERLVFYIKDYQTHFLYPFSPNRNNF